MWSGVCLHWLNNFSVYYVPIGARRTRTWHGGEKGDWKSSVAGSWRSFTTINLWWLRWAKMSSSLKNWGPEERVSEERWHCPMKKFECQNSKFLVDSFWSLHPTPSMENRKDGVILWWQEYQPGSKVPSNAWINIQKNEYSRLPTRSVCKVVETRRSSRSSWKAEKMFVGQDKLNGHNDDIGEKYIHVRHLYTCTHRARSIDMSNLLRWSPQR